LAIYPAITYIVYTPLGWLSAGIIQILTQFLCLLGLGGVVWLWGRASDPHPSFWLIALFISPPVLEAVYLDQFNAVVALLSLTLVTLLLSRQRSGPLTAVLSVFTLVTRPFNSIPLLPGLGHLFLNWRRLLRLAGLGALVLTGLMVLTWLWDAHFVSDTLHSTTNRLLIGPSSLVRQHFGTLALLLFLGLCAALEWYITRLKQSRQALDVAAIMIALSIIPIQLGGPYTTIYLLPILIRLVHHLHSPMPIIAFSCVYGFLMFTAYFSFQLHWVFSMSVFNIYVYAPIILAISASVFLLNITNNIKPESSESELLLTP
jgi:hypothetical protein